MADLKFSQHITIAARSYLVQLLDDCDGNVTHAAERAGLRRQSMYKLLARLGLSADEHRPEALHRKSVSRVFREWSGGACGGQCGPSDVAARKAN